MTHDLSFSWINLQILSWNLLGECVISKFPILGMPNFADESHHCWSARPRDFSISKMYGFRCLLPPSTYYIWVFPKMVGFPPKPSNLNRDFHYKSSILGYHYFWKHPYMKVLGNMIAKSDVVPMNSTVFLGVPRDGTYSSCVTHFWFHDFDLRLKVQIGFACKQFEK